jgi:hypothetical protein
MLRDYDYDCVALVRTFTSGWVLPAVVVAPKWGVTVSATAQLNRDSRL